MWALLQIRGHPGSSEGGYLGVSEPSTETRRVLPGWSGAGVEDRFPRGVHPLDDQVVQHHLLLGSLDNLLLHGAFGHQTVDVDLQG